MAWSSWSRQPRRARSAQLASASPVRVGDDVDGPPLRSSPRPHNLVRGPRLRLRRRREGNCRPRQRALHGAHAAAHPLRAVCNHHLRGPRDARHRQPQAAGAEVYRVGHQRRAHHKNRQAHAHLHARRAILVVDALGKGRLGRVVVRRAQRRQPARHDQVARPARRDLPQLHREQQRHGARRVAPLRVGRRLARRLGGVRRYQKLRPRRRGLVGVAKHQHARRLPLCARRRLQGRAPRPRRRRR